MKQRTKELWLLLILVLVCICLWGCHHSDAPKDAKSNSSEVEGLRDLETRAERGDIKAQRQLAGRYINGDGVPQDDSEAVKWFRKAAEQGDSKSEYDLGLLYANGQGVALDFSEAIKWFRMAAEQGKVEAQSELGHTYFNGVHVQKDVSEAAKWYKMAGQQGDLEAQVNLGPIYMYGLGVAKDTAEAAKWYRKAAEQGDVGAEYCLGRQYETGNGVRRDFAEAFKWYGRAAEQGDALSQLCLGGFFDEGKGVSMNKPQAAKWYRRAAEQGDDSAEDSLGFCYAYGEGVPKDYVEAYKWLNLSAAQGSKGAGELRDEVARLMTPEMIAEGQRRASAFVPKEENPTPNNVTPHSPETFTFEEAAKASVGTGFFVTDDGYFVTCEHVVRGATSFYIKTPGGSLRARLVAKDSKIDITVLKVAGAFLALPVAPEPQIKLGDSVFTIGFPNPDVQGVAPKLTKGEISSLAGIHDDPRYFQISVPVQPGNSGGALVDERGNVVGVVTARLDDAATYEASGALPQNVNYAVKGGLVYNFLNRLPELGGKLKPPHTATDRESANGAAERAAVLVIAE